MTSSVYKFAGGAFTVAAFVFAAGAGPIAAPKPVSKDDDRDERIRHVLLISIDGMHALDYENCVKAGTCPHLAGLGETGVVYARTSTSKPSAAGQFAILAVESPSGGQQAHSQPRDYRGDAGIDEIARSSGNARDRRRRVDSHDVHRRAR